MCSGRSFATNRATAGYYERRAGEYDQWYLGEDRFGGRDRPGWPDEVGRLISVVAGLAPTRTLDVACGTGYLTQHLRGLVAGLDQSRSMVGGEQILDGDWFVGARTIW
jgi:SAM-dependent methyltransferase